MVLIDTSSWVHQLRNVGDLSVRRRVEALLVAGEASWCPIVRLELWNGAGGPQDKKILKEYEGVLIELPITDQVWAIAYKIAQNARVASLTVPASDILVAACARAHSCTLEHCDKHFDLLAGIG